jgi:hypothetical protein
MKKHHHNRNKVGPTGGEPRMADEARAQRTAEEARAQRTADEARAQEKRNQEAARQSAQETVRMSDELGKLGAETMAVWMRINQEVWRDVLDLQSSTTRETTQLMTQLQHTGMDAWRELQGATLRWYTMWPEAFRDPLRFYQRALEESMETARRSLHATRQNSELVTRSLQQMQSSAEEASRNVHQTFQDAASKLQEVTQRTERLRAA